MVLWLFALEVLPNLHLATHERTAHHHDANGAIVFDPPESGSSDASTSHHSHTHVFPYISKAEVAALANATDMQASSSSAANDSLSSHVHTHVFPYISQAEVAALAKTTTTSAAKRRAAKRRSEHGWKAPLDHGDNSYAHRTAAVKSPGPAITSPMRVGFVATYLVAEKPGILYSIAAARPRARGPPTSLA